MTHDLSANQFTRTAHRKMAENLRHMRVNTDSDR